MRHITLFFVALAVALFTVQVQPAQAQTGAFATVTRAHYLNVRNAPTINAGVVAIVKGGYTYAVTARNADASWWLITMQPTGLQGWASGAYLSVTNAHLVPTINAPAPTPAGFATGTVSTGRLNVRATPDPINGAIIATVSEQDVFRLLERTSGRPTWYKVALASGTTGWVNGNYLVLANASLVPITGGVVTPTRVEGVVTAYFLNIRSEPNPYNANNIIMQVTRGQILTVTGRNSTGTWWQIALPSGAFGWVNGRYLTVTGGQNLPVR